MMKGDMVLPSEEVKRIDEQRVSGSGQAQMFLCHWISVLIEVHSNLKQGFFHYSPLLSLTSP